MQISINVKIYVQSLGSEVFDDNENVVKRSEIVFLSVKPVVMPSVMSQIRNISAGKLFISIAMGVTLNQLEQVRDSLTYITI